MIKLIRRNSVKTGRKEGSEGGEEGGRRQEGKKERKITKQWNCHGLLPTGYWRRAWNLDPYDLGFGSGPANHLVCNPNSHVTSLNLGVLFSSVNGTVSVIPTSWGCCECKWANVWVGPLWEIRMIRVWLSRSATLLLVWIFLGMFLLELDYSWVWGFGLGLSPSSGLLCSNCSLRSNG